MSCRTDGRSSRRASNLVCRTSREATTARDALPPETRRSERQDEIAADGDLMTLGADARGVDVEGMRVVERCVVADLRAEHRAREALGHGRLDVEAEGELGIGRADAGDHRVGAAFERVDG